jgi:hypothetical protein
MLVVEPGRLSGCFAIDEAMLVPGGHQWGTHVPMSSFERAAKPAIVDTKTALSYATQQLGNHNALPYPRIHSELLRSAEDISAHIGITVASGESSSRPNHGPIGT